MELARIALEPEGGFLGADDDLYLDVGGNYKTYKKLSSSALMTWAFNFFSEAFTNGLKPALFLICLSLFC